jgi:protein-disulfide isomerase
MVEYGDFQCPHCRNAYPIVKEVQRQLGSRLRFAFRNFPLTQIHPEAEHAAEAAEALKLTAHDLMKLNVVDEIVAEPDGGAHRDHEKAAEILSEALRSNLKRLLKTPIDQLLKKRYEKFRRLGNFAEPPKGNGATG